MLTAHVFISGFVQGVGFRRFVRHHALKLGLAGWVKNLPDNRVEAVFQGTKEQVEEMISICEKGAFLSEVKDVQVDFEDMEITHKRFDITS
jgi:acylphosphatase